MNRTNDTDGESLPSFDDDLNDLSAIEEAIAEWQAGDPGTPLDEAFAELRKKYGIVDGL